MAQSNSAPEKIRPPSNFHLEAYISMKINQTFFPNQFVFNQVNTTLCCNMNKCESHASYQLQGPIEVFLCCIGLAWPGSWYWGATEVVSVRRWVVSLSKIIYIIHMMNPNYLLHSQSKI